MIQRKYTVFMRIHLKLMPIGLRRKHAQGLLQEARNDRLHWSRLNLPNTPSKDCFATEFILNPVEGTIEIFLLMEGLVGK